MVAQDKKILSRGLLIVFEGIDGTGKSTQLKLLANYLDQRGYSVVITKEPTDGVYGKRIRELYINRAEVSREEELDLFIRDRKDHVENLIQPSLADKKIVLCDRYYLSTIAYQGAAGVDIEYIAKKNAFAPQPDLALLFQSSRHVSIERITQSRGDSLNDFEQEDALTKVEQIFNSLDYPYIKYINADLSIEAVHNSVLKMVYTHLDDLN